MQNQLLMVGSLLIGLLIAGVSTYFVMKGRQAAAVQQSKIATQVELATDKERLRCAEQDLRSAKAEKEEQSHHLDGLRQQLEHSNAENARLTERSSRLSTVEAELAELAAGAKIDASNLLRISNSEAEKTQSLLSTTVRLHELEAELKSSYAAENKRASDFNELIEKHAGLEVTASRIPALERTIEGNNTLFTNLNIELGSLKEESGRLLAELKAEKDINTVEASRYQSLSEKFSHVDSSLERANKHIAELGVELSRTQAELGGSKDGLATVSNSLDAERSANALCRGEISRLTTELAEAAVRLAGERSQNEEKIALLSEAREKMSDAFKNLATEILDEKSKRFSEENQNNIGQLLTPLKERMSEFKSKVEEIHAKDIEQQAILRTELSQLKDLNRQMTEEAHGLATALKGQAKTQGNWGELILGNVLERAGLCEGKDFKKEVSFNTEEGRKRPDVIVSLPQSKHLVIDAKVSLNGYSGPS